MLQGPEGREGDHPTCTKRQRTKVGETRRAEASARALRQRAARPFILDERPGPAGMGQLSDTIRAPAKAEMLSSIMEQARGPEPTKPRWLGLNIDVGPSYLTQRSFLLATPNDAIYVIEHGVSW